MNYGSYEQYKIDNKKLEDPYFGQKVHYGAYFAIPLALTITWPIVFAGELIRRRNKN